MTNVIILYWQPGSGGDTVQHLLSLDSKFHTVSQRFDLDESGRTVVEILPWFKDNFSHTPDQWYWRDWTHNDVDMIHSCPNLSTHDTVIIPTHRRDQAVWLKENIFNSKVIGICYDKNLYPFVLGQWCKKVAFENLFVAEHYQTLLFQTLRKQNLFGAYVLKDQLRFESNILPVVLPEWDINLQLENLLLGDISILKTIGLNLDLIDSVLCTWSNQQKMLYRQQWDLTDNLKSALGYNHQAPVSTDLDLELDEYDRILIQHWLKEHDLPLTNHKLLTLNHANEYFKKLTIGNNVDN
jgi:hypothetical protein